MKPSILVVMLDFLVCSLLFFVSGPDSATPRPNPAPAATIPSVALHEAFAAPAVEAMQLEWNRDYEQQQLRAQLETETSERARLSGRIQALDASLQQTTTTLEQTTASLAQAERTAAEREREVAAQTQRVTALSAEKARLQTQRVALTESLTTAQAQVQQLATVRGQLEEQTKTLSAKTEQLNQTVASQQGTIQTLAEDVRNSQIRLEQQFLDAGDNQRWLQETIAGLAAAIEQMRTELSATEQEALAKAVTEVAKGQQELHGSLRELVKAGPGLTAGMETLQSGQSALREQTAALAKELETIQARKPGPYKAVKSARLELRTHLVKRDHSNARTSRFEAVAHPPVVQVGTQAVVVAATKHLGLDWWALNESARRGEMLEINYQAHRRQPPAWTEPIRGQLNALQADPRLATLALPTNAPGIATLQLAGPDTILGESHKLHVFKSTAAGLSFEIEFAPDLSDSRYLVLKRPLRGIVAWLENPTYRAELGDYVVTSDGKLVGLMVSRDKCLILTEPILASWAATLPLGDKPRFLDAARQLSRRL